MKPRRLALAALALVAGFASAAPRDCVELAARIDNDVSSPSGVRVTITGRNNCAEDLDGGGVAFKVRALGAGNAILATQGGRFGGTIAARGGQAETKVFVACDPDRVKSVTVSPQ